MSREMLKGTRNLVWGRSLKEGNDSVRNIDYYREFYYYKTCLCRVNDMDREFSINYKVADKGKSTARRINDYKFYFIAQGYRELIEGPNHKIYY